MMHILVLNGPNLNLLGQREVSIYGTTSLADIEARCQVTAEALGVTVSFQQSNHEGAMVDAIHDARGTCDGVVLNAGAYTHSSIALHDAIAGTALPVVELHLSNTYKREEFRRRSFIAPVAVGVIMGFGAVGYPLAITALVEHLGAGEAA